MDREPVYAPTTCYACGGEYGKHSIGCPVAEKQRKAGKLKAERKQDINDMLEWWRENHKKEWKKR